MITFLVSSPGSYIAFGLSTDTKPASPPAGCLFTETDTGKQFRVVASAWVSLLEPTALGAAAPYVILSVGTLANGVHDQSVTGNVGHVGTETDTFTFVSGDDIAGSAVLGTTGIPLSPVGDAHILYTNINALTPTFSYSAGAVDLATDTNSPDGTGVFKTGVYKITGACNIGAAGITLTGLGTFIFIVTGALTSTTASVINLANGATADNVFFVSGGAVTLATGTTFTGTILSGANAITTGAGFNLSGRLISETTINLGGGTNTFTVPLFTPSGSTAWGDITGTLAGQTDLQAALNAKADDLGADDNYVTDAEKVKLGNLSGSNTGDNINFAAPLGVDDNYVTDTEKTNLHAPGSDNQTTIAGITGTKAQFDTAVTDGNILYVGDMATVTDATIATSDITTNDATTAKHGWLQKLPGGTSTFLRADGAFAAAGGAAADPSYSPGSFTVSTETGKILVNHMKLTTTQRATIEGTGRLRIL